MEPCEFCRSTAKHDSACPKINHLAELNWQNGYYDGRTRKPSRLHLGETYLLGYRIGIMAMKEDEEV